MVNYSERSVSECTDVCMSNTAELEEGLVTDTKSKPLCRLLTTVFPNI